jgi:arylsulfatase A-like enzyme
LPDDVDLKELTKICRREGSRALNTVWTKAVVFLLAAGLPGAWGDAWAADDARPNVLILLADDLCADGLGALGNSAVKTPALDRLAQSAMVFRNAYCMGGDSPAVCRPSRNMLLSGRTYFRWKGQYAPPDGPSLPRTFKQAGYETYHHGKRGNTAPPIQALFDVDKYVVDEADRLCGEPGKEIVDQALDYLSRRKGDKPYLMYLAFSNPHDPCAAHDRYQRMYERLEIPLPKNYLPVHPFDNGEMLIRDELLAPWPRTPEEIRRMRKEYYAVVSGLDHHIGRLLEALRASGELERTIIVFSSDNGLALGSHGLLGKQSVYDAGLKTPMLVSGPGVRPGVSDSLVYLHDLFATLCELTGVQAPAEIDSVSFAPSAKGTSSAGRDSLFLSYRDCQRAIRDERWKLIRYPNIHKTQLFDLKADPYETKDLAADDASAEQIERLTKQLLDWQRRLGDVLPLSAEHKQSPEFHPPKGETLEKLRTPRKKAAR